MREIRLCDIVLAHDSSVAFGGGVLIEAGKDKVCSRLIMLERWFDVLIVFFPVFALSAIPTGATVFGQRR